MTLPPNPQPSTLNPMQYDRSAGLLLHPTSLPSPYGIGDIGPAAYKWIDFLVDSDIRLWQVLPLSPTGYGDSPYASFSSFAGNPMLISPDRLVEQGDLDKSDVRLPMEVSDDRVEYGIVIPWKRTLLRMAAKTFLKRSPFDHQRQACDSFCEQQATWLDDYSLYMAIKEFFDAKAIEYGVAESSWSAYWDRDIALREPSAMDRWRKNCAEEIQIQKVLQFFFFDQWKALKTYANDRGILIIGDLPIYVSQDSADVWASPESFRLDENGRPILVAGVPPDYFSATGQLWGNPVYNWAEMQKDHFQWWIRRFQGTRELVDIIRVDHFRGFEAGWSIPAGELTAVKGEWIAAPGMALFREVRTQLGDLPILAEDLGLITHEVDALRDQNGFPGMRILQFAFDNAEERSSMFLPHNHIKNSVVYTGTHDNDTIRGWYDSRSDKERAGVAEYFGYPLQEVHWDFIRMTFASVSQLAIVPMQDVLGLPTEDRMNTPATSSGNWAWRMSHSAMDNTIAKRLARLVHTYDRGR